MYFGWYCISVRQKLPYAFNAMHEFWKTDVANVRTFAPSLQKSSGTFLLGIIWRKPLLNQWCFSPSHFMKSSRFSPHTDFTSLSFRRLARYYRSWASLVLLDGWAYIKKEWCKNVKLLSAPFLVIYVMWISHLQLYWWFVCFSNGPILCFIQGTCKHWVVLYNSRFLGRDSSQRYEPCHLITILFCSFYGWK